MRWCKDDIVEVRGALHRRFYRRGEGPQSRYEIELTEARRLYSPPVEEPEPPDDEPDVDDDDEGGSDG